MQGPIASYRIVASCRAAHGEDLDVSEEEINVGAKSSGGGNSQSINCSESVSEIHRRGCVAYEEQGPCPPSNSISRINP